MQRLSSRALAAGKEDLKAEVDVDPLRKIRCVGSQQDPLEGRVLVEKAAPSEAIAGAPFPPVTSTRASTFVSTRRRLLLFNERTDKSSGGKAASQR